MDAIQYSNRGADMATTLERYGRLLQHQRRHRRSSERPLDTPGCGNRASIRCSTRSSRRFRVELDRQGQLPLDAVDDPEAAQLGPDVRLNYTLSKSIDLGSAQENAGSFSGFVQNTWNVSQMRAVSSYDALHQANAFVVWQLRSAAARGSARAWARAFDAVVGGWQISANWVQTSGLPFSVTNGRQWSTNWNMTPNATPNGKPHAEVTSNKNAPACQRHGGRTEPVVRPGRRVCAGARRCRPERLLPDAARRGQLRPGHGRFQALDDAVSTSVTRSSSAGSRSTCSTRSASIPTSATNQITQSSRFGKLTGTLTSPRQMQFALRYDF